MRTTPQGVHQTGSTPDYHFPGSSPNGATHAGDPGALSRLMSAKAVYETSGSTYWLGETLHTFADSWAHDGFTAWQNYQINDKGRRYTPARNLEQLLANTLFIGHANLIHEPDQPYRFPGKARQAAMTIYNLLPSHCCNLDDKRTRNDLMQQFQFASEDERVRSANMRNIIISRFGQSPTYSNRNPPWEF